MFYKTAKKVCLRVSSFGFQNEEPADHECVFVAKLLLHRDVAASSVLYWRQMEEGRTSPLLILLHLLFHSLIWYQPL